MCWLRIHSIWPFFACRVEFAKYFVIYFGNYISECTLHTAHSVCVQSTYFAYLACCTLPAFVILLFAFAFILINIYWFFFSVFVFVLCFVCFVCLCRQAHRHMYNITYLICAQRGANNSSSKRFRMQYESLIIYHVNVVQPRWMQATSNVKFPESLEHDCAYTKSQ